MNIVIGGMSWPQRNNYSRYYGNYQYNNWNSYVINYPGRTFWWEYPLRDWGKERRTNIPARRGLRRYTLRPMQPLLNIIDYIITSCRFGLRLFFKRLSHYRGRGRNTASVPEHSNFITSSDGKDEKKWKMSLALARPSQRSSRKRAGLPYNVMSSIAQHLHYTELVSVSQSSPQLQALFFGSTQEQVQERLDALRKDACSFATKSQCEFCDSQICDVSILPSPPIFIPR